MQNKTQYNAVKAPYDQFDNKNGFENVTATKTFNN